MGASKVWFERRVEECRITKLFYSNKLKAGQSTRKAKHRILFYFKRRGCIVFVSLIVKRQTYMFVSHYGWCMGPHCLGYMFQREIGMAPYDQLRNLLFIFNFLMSGSSSTICTDIAWQKHDEILPRGRRWYKFISPWFHEM